MAAAATLAGIPNTDHDTTLLPLCADPGDKHRRRVWEAWTTSQGRAGRWSALHRLGVTIRAYPANEVASFTDCPEAKDIEYRQTQVPRSVWRVHRHGA